MKRGIFLLIDAFLALTLAILLSLSVAVFSQAHEPMLVQLHQLGRDYLVLQHKQGVSFDFAGLTGFNSTSRHSVGSKIVVYPRLCVDPPLPPANPHCFSGQDVFDSRGARKVLVFNTTVSP
ncbi:MAG: hypothetical protein QXR53_00195 [Candidatus Norongarragalinales archaeon]